MPDASTLVQAKETTCISSQPQTLRDHLAVNAPAEAVASEVLYAAIDELEEKDFLTRQLSCCTTAWFTRHEDSGEVKINANRCRLRWCYFCSEARQSFITNQITPWFTAASKPKLLTLTVRSSTEPLKNQIDFLYKSFAKLRRRKFVADRLYGGIWFFQVTLSQKTGLWHPHIHALIDSEYMEHKQLMTLWEKITGGSRVVHIRAVHNPERTLQHNARYAARPSSLVDLPMGKAIELFMAFNGRRICGSWGTAKSLSFRPAKPEDHEKWHSLGNWSTIINLQGMDDRADAILNAWKNSTPLEVGCALLHLEHYNENLPPPDTPGTVQPYLTNFYN